MKCANLILAALALGLVWTHRATADTVTLGTAISGWENADPFIPTYTGLYQQVYTSSAFTGPVEISEIAFATAVNNINGPEATSTMMNLTLGLSTTTTAAPSGLNNTYAQNRGPDFTQVFSGNETFAPAYNGSFDYAFPITPFYYNPANGNLLLDVNIGSITNTPSSAYSWFLGTEGTQIGKVYTGIGPGIGTAVSYEGILTQLTVSAVPEPSSLLLLACGVIGLGSAATRTRRRIVGP